MNQNNVVKKTGRKESPVRKLFNRKDGKLHCSFTGCIKSFSNNTNAIILQNHIDKFHGHNMTTDINNVTTLQISDEDIAKRAIYNAYAVAFAKNSLPHILIENKYFRKAIETSITYKHPPNFKMTKAGLRESIISEGTKINSDILNMLSVNGQLITLAFDGWSNIRGDKVTNILLICSGTPYFYTSIENHDSPNNVNWLVPKLTEKITHLIKKKLKVIALTTDNENLMKATRKKLQEIFPVLIIVPCSAHIIQLCFKKMCFNDKIKKIIDDAKSIINIFNSNRAYYTKLIQLQEKDKKVPLNLIQSSDVRWTSLIDSIERLLTLKTYIEDIYPGPYTTFWNKLEALNLLLKPFKVAIANIQKDDATLYSVWCNFNSIIDFYMSTDVPLEFRDVIGDILKLIKEKWDDHIDGVLIDACRLFNLEMNFRLNELTCEKITEWGSIYLTYYEIVKNVTQEKIKENLSIQLCEFILRKGSFSSIGNKMLDLQRMCSEQKRHYNINLLWSCYYSTHYELTHVVLAILSICPSESCVERSFSAQADVHSEERNRLHDVTIEAELNIKLNLK